MRDGFIKAGAATPKVKVADVTFNRERMEEMAREAGERGVKLLVFPELAMTAYTCGDLFGQKLLLEAAKEGLKEFAAGTADLDMLIFVGLPWAQDGKLYNVAAAVKGGKVLGLVPKLHLPNYGEFYEARNFEPGNEEPVLVDWEGLKLAPAEADLFLLADKPWYPHFGEIYTALRPDYRPNAMAMEFYTLRRWLEDLYEWIQQLLFDRPDAKTQAEIYRIVQGMF